MELEFDIYKGHNGILFVSNVDMEILERKGEFKYVLCAFEHLTP